jgi:hypothetical protein
MTVVFESMFFRSARRQRTHRIKSIQGLNGSLFIDAEDCRVLGRVHVQGDNVGGFLFKLRIVAGHVAFEPMRFYPRLTPDTLHSRLAEAKCCRQPSARPMGTTIHRRLRSLTQHFRLYRGRYRSRLAALMLSFQPGYSVFFKTRFSSVRWSGEMYSVHPRSAYSSCRPPKPESATPRTHHALPESATATTASVPHAPSQLSQLPSPPIQRQAFESIKWLLIHRTPH